MQCHSRCSRRCICGGSPWRSLSDKKKAQVAPLLTTETDLKAFSFGVQISDSEISPKSYKQVSSHLTSQASSQNSMNWKPDLGNMNVCIVLDYHRKKKSKSEFLAKANQQHNMNEHDLFITGEVWQNYSTASCTKAPCNTINSVTP